MGKMDTLGQKKNFTYVFIEVELGSDQSGKKPWGNGG